MFAVLNLTTAIAALDQKMHNIDISQREIVKQGAMMAGAMGGGFPGMQGLVKP